MQDELGRPLKQAASRHERASRHRQAPKELPLDLAARAREGSEAAADALRAAEISEAAMEDMKRKCAPTAPKPARPPGAGSGGWRRPRH